MQKCKYCGDNPVPHTMYRFNRSFDIRAEELGQKIWFQRSQGIDDFVHDIIKIFYWILTQLWVIFFNRDVKKVPYPRGIDIRQEAVRRDIEMVEIKPFNKSIDLYRATIKGKYLYFINLPRPDKIDKNLGWIDDKYLFKKLLAKHHVPHSTWDTHTNLDQALEYFETLEKPVVIKPRVWSRSRHTTTNIRTKQEFIQAFHIAKQLCHRVIVEEQLQGAVYRGTVIWGKLRAVMWGTYPEITGDGKRTIKELIVEKNKHKNEVQSDIRIDQILDNYLQSIHFCLTDILPKGKTIRVSEKSGVANGWWSINLTPTIHPDNKKMFEQAAKIAESPILGFDFIIPDITQSYKDQKCGIIECNAAPFIHLHNHVTIGKPINVSKYIRDLIDK